MTKTEVIHFIKDTYLYFQENYDLTQNEFAELLGMDRRNFCYLIRDDYNRGECMLRMARRVCHLLMDAELRGHVREWLEECRAKEIYEEWHGKTYTKQVRRKELDGHKDRKAKKVV